MPKRNKKTPKPTGPQCPACRRRSDNIDDRGYAWCPGCKCWFDPADTPEPSHNDPVRAAIAAEERHARAKREARWGR